MLPGTARTARSTTAKNNYGIDRDIQRFSSSGIDGIGLQDSALQEAMGAIVDRSKETLGSSDLAIVAWRKLMSDQARHPRDTGELLLPHKPELYRVRSVGIVLPRETDFEVGAHEKMLVAWRRAAVLNAKQETGYGEGGAGHRQLA